MEPAPPATHYEYENPGDLLPLDIKKLGRFRRPGHRVKGPGHGKSRGVGLDYVHVAIDDHSRVAFACIKPDERGTSACRALIQALRYYRQLGIRFAALMTGQRRLLPLTLLPPPSAQTRPPPRPDAALHT